MTFVSGFVEDYKGSVSIDESHEPCGPESPPNCTDLVQCLAIEDELLFWGERSWPDPEDVYIRYVGFDWCDFGNISHNYFEVGNESDRNAIADSLLFLCSVFDHRRSRISWSYSRFDSESRAGRSVARSFVADTNDWMYDSSR